MIILKTTDQTGIKKIVEKISLPKNYSHKGQNGKVLIIGGSSLFHAASLWSAEIASYFVDMVHYSSNKENQQIFVNLKTKFRNGIVVSQKNLLDYVFEDDAILIGPGMLRKKTNNFDKNLFYQNFKKIINIRNEADYSYALIYYLIKNFPQKKFVFDAGALQVMNKDWFLNLKTRPIITPHQKEFENLFKIKITKFSSDKKIELVKNTAKKYQLIILLKSVDDIITDGETVYKVQGGNPGLTKGGSGDILAGLTTVFYAKNDPLISAVLSSYLVKKTADYLFSKYKYWYNISTLLKNIPLIFSQLL